jgi:hypothetical protein
MEIDVIYDVAIAPLSKEAFVATLTKIKSNAVEMEDATFGRFPFNPVITIDDLGVLKSKYIAEKAMKT